jgi:RNA polymerase sigma-70 factor (ECF subfamily)
LEFHQFDEEYLRRLAAGDKLVSDHFSVYFGELLSLKLRNRVRSPQLAEDVRQETLARVLLIVRRKGGVEHPERFGAFVNAVANNVLLELSRAEHRHDPLAEGIDPRDPSADLDAALVSGECKRQVREVLAELPAKDRDILRWLFLEGKDRAEISARLAVDEEYLRVLLYRAKDRFRARYVKRVSTVSL